MDGLLPPSTAPVSLEPPSQVLGGRVLRVASRLHHAFLSRALTGASRRGGVIVTLMGIEPTSYPE
mgnify:CR=1 FL=1